MILEPDLRQGALLEIVMSVASLKGTLYDNLSASAAARETAPGAQEASAGQTSERHGVAVRLIPSDAGDRTVVANYVALNPTSGIAFIDFGFLEPSLVQGVQLLMREGKEVPEVINGRLASRVALSYEVMFHLYSQLAQFLLSLQQQETQRPEGEPAGPRAPV